MFNRKNLNYTKKKMSLPFDRPINSKMSDSDFLPYITRNPDYRKFFVRSSQSKTFNRAQFKTINVS